MTNDGRETDVRHPGDRPGIFRKVLGTVEWIEDQVGGLLLLVASLLVFIQIVLRLMDLSLSGLYEIASFCAIWSVFLTAGVGIQRNIHVRVDVLAMISPPKVAFLMNVTSDLLVIIVTAALCYSGYLLIDESLTFGDSTLGIISIPMWIPQLIMPAGGFLMLVHALAHLGSTLEAGTRPASSQAAGDPQSGVMSI